MTLLINGEDIARRVRERVAGRVAGAAANGRVPCLATVLIGDDPAGAAYAAAQLRAVRAAGLRDAHYRLPGHVSQPEAAALLDTLAADPEVSGILLHLPLPPHLDSASLIDRIPAAKDVDGLTAVSAERLARGGRGLRPCTPSAVVHLLDAEGVPLRGARVTVVGWGAAVGRPLVPLLLRRGATVTVAHEATADLAAATRPAEILVVAAGVRGLVGAEHVGPGATVVDVGIHRTPAGIAGDVRADELDGVAGRVTPVPGGVGPVTTAMLLANTLRAAEWAAGPQAVPARPAPTAHPRRAV